MANNDQEMQRMQQDAIRRVREMQSRAQQTLNHPPETPVPHRETSARNQAHPPEVAPAAPSAAPEMPTLPAELAPKQENPITDLFNGLLADSERTLILVLILLLISEKADTYLIFALMYLVI